ncbi:MAG TPA: 50S ribosomal protein L11 methyltransferase [Stellaceae bacterium]|nr:50S ribosomal protein L11 methyltransferase [Stellaceae bacterium]
MDRILWRVACVVADAAGAEAAFLALEPALSSVSVFEAGAEYLVEGLSLEAPARGALEARLELAFIGATPAPALTIERLPPRDWLKENRESFQPISAGRYYIHGSHGHARAPAGHIALEIDAATAFGTGEHASTRGCLKVMEALARRGRRRRVLDMGTGTGILAIAALKTWHGRVAAFDIEAEAVRVARINARANGVAGALKPGRAGTYRVRALRRRAPFDLVLANILARPLAAMARDLARVLDQNGVAVLSGILPRQEPIVLAAHRRVRLPLASRVVVDGWSTLAVTRARRPGGLSLR